MRIQVIFYLLISFTTLSQNLYKDDPKEYIKLSVQTAPFNYPDKSHQLDGFFRQRFTSENQIIYHSEAAITVQDGSYVEDTSNLRIKINGYRLIEDSRQIDSAYVQRITTDIPREVISNRVNDFYDKYLDNYLRLIYNPLTVFSNGSNFIWGKQFRFEDSMIDDNDIIIKYQYKGEPLVDSSFLRINYGNLAIQEFTRNQYIQGNVLNKVHVQFRKASDQKYYPNYIKVIEPAFLNANGAFKQFVITEFYFKESKTMIY